MDVTRDTKKEIISTLFINVSLSIVLALNLHIDLYTPTVGIIFFVGSGITKVLVTQVIKSFLPSLLLCKIYQNDKKWDIFY
jgi:TRAP-type C4-dicarboxylate transport system permease large subunit